MNATVMHYVWILLIGLAAGWIAGQLTRGRSMGLAKNLIVGVVGALIGGFVFQLVGIYAGGLVGQLVTAVVGAVLLLFLVRYLK